MASSKRDAIMASLAGLLETRPLNRITVRDIVEDCGVNRNTFYYHFEDISAVIEALILRDANQVLRDFTDVSSLDQCFEAAIQMGLKSKNAVYHIYNSTNRDFLERRLMEVCKYAVTQFVDRSAEGIQISSADREIIIHAYQCEVFGWAIDWLNGGMKDDAINELRRLCKLRQGFTKEMLRRSQLT